MGQLTQISLRLSDQTLKHLDTMCAAWSIGRAQIMEIAIERLFEEPLGELNISELKSTITRCQVHAQSVLEFTSRLEQLLQPDATMLDNYQPTASPRRRGRKPSSHKITEADHALTSSVGG